MASAFRFTCPLGRLHAGDPNLRRRTPTRFPQRERVEGLCCTAYVVCGRLRGGKFGHLEMHGSYFNAFAMVPFVDADDKEMKVIHTLATKTLRIGGWGALRPEAQQAALSPPKSARDGWSEDN